MMKTLSGYIEDMLLFKESIGYSRKSYEYDLARFCRFIESKQLNVTELKEDVVLNWCSRWENETPTGARRRIQPVRELLKYLFAIGIDCYVIPSSFLPRQKTRTSYIFTDKEMLDIFDECDKLTPVQCSPYRHLILPVLLRLVFFCGLRPNEGRELQSQDIDFDKGIVLIRKNKSHKERYVALSDYALQMLKNYRSTVSSIFKDHTYFFPSPNGKPYNRRWFARQFQMIWKKVKQNVSGANAVIYDVRHRHATTIMMKWLNEGVDLNAKLPYLSAYMGHTHFSDTAYYIHLLPENLIRSSAIDWGHFSDLIPEVAEDE
jgi:integrase